MIVIVVEGGVVQQVYSDNPDEDVKVLDLDNELDDDATPVSRQQVEAELKRIAEEMHQVI